MLTERIIKKHVAIIHAYSSMSSLQRKIVNVLLFEALNNKNRLNHQESVAIECRISLTDLLKTIKFNSHNTQYLKEAIDGLASQKIEWNLLKDKVPTNISFFNLRILHGSPTFYQDNTLNFSFHKVMLDLVDNPAIYGSIDLDIQAEFESKYSIALYENSTRFINLQKDKIIQLDTFRKMLGVHEDKYDNMRELNRNVISPALEEVNDRSDFVVSLDSIKAGRKITGFKLAVNTKKTLIKKTIPTNQENEKLLKELKHTFGHLNENILKTIFKNHAEEYIFEKIHYTKKYAKKDVEGLYPIPYFISALKNNYKITEPIPLKEMPLCNGPNEEEQKLIRLHSDLNHWRKMLEYAKASKNSSQIKNVQKIITECELKLSGYLELIKEA